MTRKDDLPGYWMMHYLPISTWKKVTVRMQSNAPIELQDILPCGFHFRLTYRSELGASFFPRGHELRLVTSTAKLSIFNRGTSDTKAQLTTFLMRSRLRRLLLHL